MASTVVVPQHLQLIGEALARGGNLPALGQLDHNLAIVREVDGKPQPKFSGPPTGRDCPLLLANAPQKNIHTMTSILTARCKMACGLTNNQKEKIVDIDASDAGNDLAAVEYVEEIYKFYRQAETESHFQDYMNAQPEIEEKMRAILVDWLIELHDTFELMPETLYLTINIIDRYLAVQMVTIRELQLVGIGATLLASKYEEMWAVEATDFVCLTDGVYTRRQILEMEKAILEKLEWTLTVPTPYMFLVRFIKASIPDKQMEDMVYFLAELGVMNYATAIYRPSMLAASAVYAARLTLNRSPAWDATLKAYTGYSETQLRDCAKLLASFHSAAAGSVLEGVYKKYSQPERSGVSLLPPAKYLLPPPGFSLAVPSSVPVMCSG